MPVARKLWQPSRVRSPAFLARRTIMRRASWRVMRSPVSCLRPRPPSVRNSGEAFSAARSCRRHIGVEIMLQQMMRRHLVLLAAFFMQSYPPALALRVIVLDVPYADLRPGG